MWTDIANNGHDLQWVKTAFSNGMGLWKTNGSYHKSVAPYTSGAGWIFYCKKLKKCLTLYFYKFSLKAG